jgi:hypothetical protein
MILKNSLYRLSEAKRGSIVRRKRFAIKWVMRRANYTGCDVAMWLGAKEAGRYIGFSADWVEVRAMPWESEPVDRRIRFKRSKSDGRRRYYVPDLEAQLEE